jgi:hypothetical protein
MVKTNYPGLNPVVVKALTNLHYRYSDEMPKMWCSRIRVLFKKLLEYNPRFFSKNEYIHMTEREYKNGEFRLGERTSHIYCTVCDLLVFILNNTEKYANNHLNECIARIEQRHIVYVRSILLKQKIKKGLSSDEINKLYGVYLSYRKSYEGTASNTPEGKKFMERMAYRILNSTKAIQQAWWSYKLGPETKAQRVWNMVRNDDTPDRKKYLGMIRENQKIMNPEMQEEYAKACDKFYVYFRKYYSKYIGIINPVKFTPPYEEYVYYSPDKWIEAKKHQLRRRLDKAVYGPIPDFSGRFTFELISTISYYEKYYVVVRNGPDTAFMLVR